MELALKTYESNRSFKKNIIKILKTQKGYISYIIQIFKIKYHNSNYTANILVYFD